MTSRIQKTLAALAACTLIATPVAAQANTRAGDSGTIYGGSQSQPGTGRSSNGESVAGSGEIIALVLAALWAAGLVVIVAEGADNENQSPGAN